MDNVELMKMPYELLKEITHDFSKQLGSGTYGVVYKGTKANGKEVAVKVLRDMAALDDKEFMNEFQNLAKLNHQNIVRLVGYCNESEPVIVECDGRQVAAEKLHVALCFEYVNNGSLSNHISDEKHGLEWHIRYKIIKGICEGLNYLHDGPHGRVLHLDLKPDNILLDKEMVPKIADFGLSRLIGDERTKQTMNKFIGTHGYLPPEYTKFQLLSPSFDIFSLGIIITKIMMGRQRYHEIADMPPRKLVKHVHTIWKNRLQEIEGLRSRLEVYCQQVKTCIELASKCLMEDRYQRPTIQQIVATLTETEMIHSIPSRQIQEFHDGQSTHASRRSIVTSVSTSATVPAGVLACFTITALQTRKQRMLFNKNGGDILKSVGINIYTKAELKAITKSYSKRVGGGFFGDVYKGTIEDGAQTQHVAVKFARLRQSQLRCVAPQHKQDLAWTEGFMNEIIFLFQIKHPNVVRLIGCCLETEVPILVFEYVNNGSLHDKLHVADKHCYISLLQRLDIAIGSAQALSHIHSHGYYNHVHGDIKPANILLDENLQAKVLPVNKYVEDMATDGNYVDPVYYKTWRFTVKSDVYSFGVVLLELITRKTSRYGENRSLPIDFEKSWKDQDQRWSMYDPDILSVDLVLKKYLDMLGTLAVECLNGDVDKRPTMGDVVVELKKVKSLAYGGSCLEGPIVDEASKHVGSS